MTSRPRALTLTAAALTTATLLASCGSSGGNAGGSGTSSNTAEKVAVVAAFYPLEYAAQRVGGDFVQVTNLTKPGVEPHDLELTPQDVAKVSSAKVAIYTKGFQAAVDKAITEQSPKGAYDTAKDADLKKLEEHESHAEGDADAHEGHEGHEGHDHGGVDPHFWLDPQRYAKVVKGIAGKLAEADPAHKADFEKNAEAFTKELTALDEEFTKGLKSCASKNMVTSHAAFGYLTERFGLEQMAISGLSPDKEPQPARLAKITSFVKAKKVSTIYTETLVSPAVAKTIADSSGAQTAVLDPIEGLSDKSAGKNYLEVMRANLATLKKGQSCS